ncbi:SitI3 family protein [Micromonospora sp. NBC_01813]|uniref:SitI3 family protein n=1 Tax=Micromonospora sp. NBC_01813 TaxID=2975988 RepID=UPI002DD86D51|nr:SitI3 family protein [Micromonospora sp. NBC_01813]WSA07033.1 SitI3 family protein [Micromonospora sp. NBC_01813]
MANEYWLYSGADVTREQVLALLATAFDAEHTDFGLGRGESLAVTAWPVDSEERIEVAQDTSVAEPKIGALFRLRSVDTIETADRETREILDAVLALIRAHPAEAVLQFDTDTVLRHTNWQVVLNSDWPGWEEIPALAAIVAGHPARSMD